MNNHNNTIDNQQGELVNYDGDPEDLSYLVDGSLDHALLESLFYNEMALLSSGNNSDEGLFSSTDSQLHLPPSVPSTSDSVNGGFPSFMEGDLMSSAQPPLDALYPPTSMEATPLYHPPPSYFVVPPPSTMVQSSSYPPNVALSAPPVLRPSVPAGIPAQRPLVTKGGIRHNVVAVLDQDGRTQLPPIKKETTEDEKRQKLVAQFATLAERLGITLPPPVLEKLTHQASSTPATSTEAPMETPAEVDTSPPQLLQQLQTTAAAAIAAVKRGPSSLEATTTTTISEKPYSKRRKKPRLSDCEQKLQELQSENAILKRHLDNIANRNARLDQERIKAETQMRQLLQENAPDQVLDPIVKNFTEMYSDYGRKRHDELNFHLQQLKRLANPTNFTKMGLWTLGGGVQESSAASPSSGGDGGSNSLGGNGGKASGNGSSNKNPIAGMLQRELGISVQQGRKILEQRQKIQNVCSNLKECLLLLAKLNSLCEKKTQIFHNRMTKCQEVLTPRQVVKLLIWIDDNSQTLGSVCPGWGSEQFQSKKTATSRKENVQ